MYKREKEVYEYLLDNEESAIKALEKHYKAALDDVRLCIRIMQADEQTQSKIRRIKYQKKLEKQLEGIIEKLHMAEYKTIKQYLESSYTDAFVGTMYTLHGQDVPIIAPIDQNAAIKAIQLDTKLTERKIHASATGELVTLYESLGVDVDKLKKVARSEITRGFASGMLYDDIARNVSNTTKAPLSRAKAIVRTDGHRIQQQSAEDARQAAKARGADVVKQWYSTLDGDTRPTHRALDGQIKETNEPFVLGTKKAMHPGDFGDPAEDCNCRCVALTRARKALDAEELATLKERAKFFGLAEDDGKKQTFAEFEKKYLKAAQSLEKPGESSIIQERIDTFVKDLAAGKINTKISPQKQARHRYGSNEYKRYSEKLSGLGDKPSYILEELSLDALAEMVKGKLGTGIIEVKKDNSIQEFFDCDDYVGYWYDKEQKKFIATKRVQVKYALGGGNIHIIPIMERK